MFKVEAEIRSIRKQFRIKNKTVEAIGSAESKDNLDSYVTAQLEVIQDGIQFYFECPKELLDDSVNIEDKFIITVEKVK